MTLLPILCVVLLAVGVQGRDVAVDENSYVQGSVNGLGSPMVARLLDEWNFAYLNEKPNITIGYTPKMAALALSTLQNMTDNHTGDYYHFAIADVPVTEALVQQYDMHSFPFAGIGVVPIVNLPGFEAAGETVLLDCNILVEIYRGRINNWRDPQIINDNLDVAHLLPNQTIQVLIRRDVGGISKIFSGGLAAMSDTWKQEAGVFRSWPSEYSNTTLYPNFKAITGDFTMFSTVALNPFSIGFVSLPLAFAYSDQIQMPVIRGPLGNILVPNPGVEEAMASLTFANGFEQDVVGYTAGAWPMVGLVYVYMRNNTHVGCELKTEFFKFLHWAETFDIPRARALTEGYASFTDEAAAVVIQSMKSFICNEKPILQQVRVTEDRTAGHEALLGISMVLLVLVVVTAASVLMRSTKEGRIFSIVLLLGGALCYVSVIFWYLIPSEDYICSARMWLTCLGFSLLLVAMFAKTWQIRKLYVEIFKKQKLSLEVIGFLEVLTTIGIVIAVQLVILIVWSAISPFTAEDVLFDPINLESHWECSCENATSWIIVQAVFFGLLLLWGMYVVYSTWHAKRVLESRWILIATYNLFLVLCVILPFIFLIDIKNDNQLYYMAVVPINFGATSTIVAVCMPVVVKKIIKKIKDSWSGSKSGGTSNNTKTTHNSGTNAMSVSITSDKERDFKHASRQSGNELRDSKDVEMQASGVPA